MWCLPNVYKHEDTTQLDNIVSTSSDLEKAKKQPSNHALYRIGLATILVVSPAVSGLSCRNHTQEEKEATPAVVPREYNIQNLVDALGEKWQSLDDKQKDTVRDRWSKSEDDIKGLIVDVYSDPNGVYNRFSEDNQKRFDKFKVSKKFEKKVSKYKKELPWMNPKQLTLADMLLIYMLERIGYIANL